jgi:hypothetical protein
LAARSGGSDRGDSARVRLKVKCDTLPSLAPLLVRERFVVAYEKDNTTGDDVFVGMTERICDVCSAALVMQFRVAT